MKSEESCTLWQALPAPCQPPWGQIPWKHSSAWIPGCKHLHSPAQGWDPAALGCSHVQAVSPRLPRPGCHCPHPADQPLKPL